MKTAFILQDRLTRGINPYPAAAALDAEVIQLSTTTSQALYTRLLELDAQLAAEAIRPILFVSIQAARFIKRRCPHLARGIGVPEAFLRHGNYTSHLAPAQLLNPTGIYLPWDRIPTAAPMLETLFGARIFLRPDSPMKPFPGFAVDIKHLAEEWHLRGQTDQVDLGEMVFIAPAIEVPEQEYRLWVFEEKIVTASSYSWDPELPHEPVPEPVLEAGLDIARQLLYHETVYTADFTMIDGAAKLIELNALSTSGWYSGMDPEKLFFACDEVFLG